MRNPDITYTYEVEGRTVTVVRKHVGGAYPRNGNVHNPTQYYTWESYLDGKLVTAWARTRAVAYEYARAKVQGLKYRPDDRGRGRDLNVRPFTLVADEMKANYRGRVVASPA